MRKSQCSSSNLKFDILNSEFPKVSPLEKCLSTGFAKCQSAQAGAESEVDEKSAAIFISRSSPFMYRHFIIPRKGPPKPHKHEPPRMNVSSPFSSLPAATAWLPLFSPFEIFSNSDYYRFELPSAHTRRY